VSDALGWIIIGGMLVALALVFLVFLLRERRAAERRFEKVMDELTSRMDGMLEELRAAADRTTDDERRGRILG
jgi:Flp pilus assembly protein TadB